ncbi:putative endo-1,3-1,4-beta glucanase [Phytophthora cinnamomi]|uniref:putative endo-1,3-1,4-beta glucanase n=1 Tax=Phytophthora cinnamomi TaxID=4785 RepID=UPI003559D25E|nr:putative endo-1,3-1,4-beta glucanase [Phytophthora cinnamomi]
MSCCPAVMEPARETAANTIVAKTYKNTKLFVAGPAQAKAGVVAIPDIFGPESSRIKQDAEALAKLGYAVVLVDAADGDYPETLEGQDVPGWLKKNSFEKVSGAHVANAIAYLQEEVGAQSISSYGYCWGAYVGAKQSALSTPVIKGHVSFHPSWMAEQLVNGEGAVQKMAEAISVPQLLCAAGNDPPLVSEGGVVEQILKDKPVVAEQSNVVNFPGMIHGWVCRGDIKDPATKEAVKKAWHLAVEFTQKVNPL